MVEFARSLTGDHAWLARLWLTKARALHHGIGIRETASLCLVLVHRCRG